jgi:hypothetical protein
MQPYLKYALGFSAFLLTREEYRQLNDDIADNKADIEIRFFTEGCNDQSWMVVVLKNLGEVPGIGGKFVTWENLKKAVSKEAIIDKPTREEIEKQLRQVNLEHMANQVELVIYVTEY